MKLTPLTRLIGRKTILKNLSYVQTARRARSCGWRERRGDRRLDRPAAPGGATNCRRRSGTSHIDGYSIWAVGTRE